MFHVTRLESIPNVSTLEILWANLQQKNYDEIEDLIQRRSGDHGIYFSYFGSVSVASPEYAKILLTESEDDATKFEPDPGSFLDKFFGSGLPFANGDKWRTHRNLANFAFNIALSPEIVGETTMDLFAFMKPKLNRPIDVYETMQRVTIEALGKLGFGHKFGCLESEGVSHLISSYKYVVSIVGSPLYRMVPWVDKLPLKSNKKYLDALKEFDGFIYDVIEARRNEIKKNSYNGRDLLTSMLKLTEQEEINTDIKQLRDELVSIFAAGHDSTSIALSVSLYFLAKYPEMQEKARAEVINILGNEPIIPNSDQLKELKYVNAIIKESLRAYPPAPIITARRLNKPVKLGPYTLPTNTICMVNAWQIHHNPKYWKNPNQYDPERFLSSEKRHAYSWVTFSSGPRNCVGQNLSLMEQRIILSMILLKYKWTLPENSINKDKLLLNAQFLLTPRDLKLVFTERINK
ncbi:unnamed protein product [Rhizophagus irregularis]|nr:unnamed protein product [Rhizophagus irregularis]